MKILALLGSPNKKGNTASLLEKFLEGAATHNVESGTVFLHSCNIAPCTACNSCRENPEVLCVIDDDMQQLYSKVYDADVLVFATPVYWWTISAQMKLFMDRLYAINYDRLKNKKVVLIMTYGGEKPNLGPELVEKMYTDICDWLGMNFYGVLEACSGNTPTSKNSDALQEAFDLGVSLAD